LCVQVLKHRTKETDLSKNVMQRHKTKLDNNLRYDNSGPGITSNTSFAFRFD
jgi:hypothetical protein